MRFFISIEYATIKKKFCVKGEGSGRAGVFLVIQFVTAYSEYYPVFSGLRGQRSHIKFEYVTFPISRYFGVWDKKYWISALHTFGGGSVASYTLCQAPKFI